jgi:DNA-binding LytR/AlgR family response regulator
MTLLSCLIVDDEPLSQDVLKKFVEDAPMLQLNGICSDALEALDFLRSKTVDLIFLDINMPKLSGINFVKTLENPPLIIFTTAYAEYAVEGFELDAVDYLLKPIAFDRFLKSVNKAIELQQAWEILERNKNGISKGEPDYLMIKSDRRIYKINIEELYYVQSYGDYVKIHTKEKVIIASETMKNMEGHLKTNCIRIHKSYLVNRTAIKYVEGNQVNIHEIMLPIGQKYRDDFFKAFNKRT